MAPSCRIEPSRRCSATVSLPAALLEANFIVSGSGELEEVATGRRWPLEAGTMYVVGPKDRHVVRSSKELRIVSVFNPPIVGDETHDADGSYPPTGPVPPGPPAA